MRSNTAQLPLIEVHPDPMVQFSQWYEAAVQAFSQLPGAHLVNAMVLATVSADHWPSARMVLLKEYNSQGFIFYTDYESRKGQEITQNAQVALLFWWDLLERQIRIEGVAKPISPLQSDDYFHSRPKESQLAATVSFQSQVLTTAEVLSQRYAELATQYADSKEDVPRPARWGGYCVEPQLFEFWQEGPHRLHERLQYRKIEQSKWEVSHLSP